jgi:hypothetical protein
MNPKFAVAALVALFSVLRAGCGPADDPGAAGEGQRTDGFAARLVPLSEDNQPLWDQPTTIEDRMRRSKTPAWESPSSMTSRGTRFDQFMQSTVLDPLRLKSSTYEQPLPEDLRAAAAIEHDSKGLPIEGDRLHIPFVAAGG